MNYYQQLYKVSLLLLIYQLLVAVYNLPQVFPTVESTNSVITPSSASTDGTAGKQ